MAPIHLSCLNPYLHSKLSRNTDLPEIYLDTVPRIRKSELGILLSVFRILAPDPCYFIKDSKKFQKKVQIFFEFYDFTTVRGPV
jgi:hypothetical protein